MIPKTLIHHIQNNILPLYDHFDRAHSQEHANTVIAQSAKLSEYYDLDKAMVYTIAAYHDLGLKQGRESHHIDSGRIVSEDEILNEWFSREQIQIIKEAVEDHRASRSERPRSIYGCIVAEADREISPLRIIRRTIQYGLKHYPEITTQGHYQRLCDHISEKYGEGGYLKVWLPESSNATKLVELREMIADREALHSLFTSIYEQETK